MFRMFKKFYRGIETIMWRIQKKKIKGVYKDDFPELLKSLGIYEQITLGKMKCEYCGDTLTLENIQALIPQRGKIIVVCSNKECLNKI